MVNNNKHQHPTSSAPNSPSILQFFGGSLSALASKPGASRQYSIPSFEPVEPEEPQSPSPGEAAVVLDNLIDLSTTPEERRRTAVCKHQAQQQPTRRKLSFGILSHRPTLSQLSSSRDSTPSIPLAIEMAYMSPLLPPFNNTPPISEEDTSDLKNDDDDDVGNSSLPPDQRRHLMEMESSFRIETHGSGTRANLFPSDIGEEEYSNTSRMGDMGPPSLPVGRISRGGQRTLANPPQQPSLANKRSTSSTRYLASEGDNAIEENTQQAMGNNNSSSIQLQNSPAAFALPSSEGDTERLVDLTSSPTVSAQARSISRVAATLGPAFDENAVRAGRNSPRPDEIGVAIDRQPSHGSMAAEAALSAIPRSTPRPIPTSTNSNNAPANNSLSSSYKRRPKFLRSRQASNRSSVSSVGMDDDSEDDGISSLTVGEPRNTLSRSTSLGSIASGVTGMGSVYGGDRNVSSASAVAANRALERLEEERSRTGSVEPESDNPDRPVTPKERKPPQPPTDTVIAAHVKNIQIPATVARDFQSRTLLGGAPGSPSKRAMAIAGHPTPHRGREMTLKEQTASIDKLQKENFDLKLKVYYLNEKLEKTSDEGVKETLKENVDMKVKLAEALRERKALKKRIKELEKIVEEMAEAKKREGEGTETRESWELREIIERYEIEIEEFRRNERSRDEKMREYQMHSQNGRHSDDEYDQLRDILVSEQNRREAVDSENQRLREEIYRLRATVDPPQYSRPGTRTQSERDRPQSRSERGLAAQLVQTRRENDDLRRDLSAQTSMLTSRNREKDGLYQQIEDLKMRLRSGSVSSVYDRPESRVLEPRAQSSYSDRILDRSVSRLGANSIAGTQMTTVSESEREEFEDQKGALRDRISELRLKNQDLEQQLDRLYAELESRQNEWENMADEVEVARAEVQEMQAERNEALRLREDIEMDFDQLKREAEQEIDRLEEEIEMRCNENYRLEDDVRIKEDDFRSLQQEMRNVSEVVVRLEDSQEAHQGETRRLEERIQELEHTIHDNEQEMNALEGTLREANDKVERLTVQGESAKGEIAFLREEQDGDKIKIGELEGVIQSLEMALFEEKDRVREAIEKLEHERKDRGERGNLKEQEYERRLNEKTDELTIVKEESRKLRNKISSQQQEVNLWRERLEEMEKGLREALGDASGNRSGLMKSVAKLHSELESALEELDDTKSELVDKVQTLKDRENLLESMALESRKLSDLLDKEKAARRTEKAQLETLQSSQSVTTRRISEHKSQVTEMERQRNRDTRSLQQLETSLRDQINERNKLLLESWMRLSIVCGNDWAHRNALVTITSSTTPGKLSMESAIASAFSGFSRNFLSACKTIESIVAGFKSKVKSVERDLWKEYQVVENALETRTRRLDRLETLVRGGIGEQSAARTEVAKLRTENRLLKAEIAVMKKEIPPISSCSSPGPSRPPTLTRARTAVEVAADALQSGGMAVTRCEGAHSVPTLSSVANNNQDSEKKWILRLRELEKRLKQEREARLLDRSMAKRKVDEARSQKQEAMDALEREKNMK